MLAALLPVLGPILTKAAEAFLPDPKGRMHDFAVVNHYFYSGVS